MILPHYAKLKRFAGVLRLRAGAYCASGRTEEALEDIMDIFKLAEILSDERFLLGFLTRASLHKIGCDAVQEGLILRRWSEAQCAAIQSRLMTEDLLSGWLRAMKAEAAQAIQSLESARLDGGFVMFVHESLGPETHKGCRQFLSTRRFPRGWFEQNRAFVAERYYDHMIPLVDVQHRTALPSLLRGEQASERQLGVTPYNLFALPLTFIGSDLRRAAHIQIVNDLTVVGCGLSRYVLKNSKLPSNLGDLLPEFIRHLPNDVIAGGPLHYRVLGADGWLLWSVGWNERDDGGMVKTNHNGVPLLEEGDWAIQIPAR